MSLMSLVSAGFVCSALGDSCVCSCLFALEGDSGVWSCPVSVEVESDFNGMLVPGTSACDDDVILVCCCDDDDDDDKGCDDDDCCDDDCGCGYCPRSSCCGLS